MVYGQPPKDMRNTQIDWKDEYHIDFKNRPCPYDFPAFEGDKPLDYDENKKDVTVTEREDMSRKKAEGKERGGRRRKSRSKGKEKRHDDKHVKNHIDKAGRKRAKRSIDEFDRCSLSE